MEPVPLRHIDVDDEDDEEVMIATAPPVPIIPIDRLDEHCVAFLHD